MLYEEVRIKQDISYISICKFILMATCLGTNAVVVTRVHCIQCIAYTKRDWPQQPSIDPLSSLTMQCFCMALWEFSRVLA